ncbi:MAG: hypothetical protein CMJ82_02665 [Planctomycetaceae bacterium]|nr:hypothetical protein [Planctomycetaceae bacterium]
MNMRRSGKYLRSKWTKNSSCRLLGLLDCHEVSVFGVRTTLWSIYNPDNNRETTKKVRDNTKIYKILSIPKPGSQKLEANVPGIRILTWPVVIGYFVKSVGIRLNLGGI